MKITGGKIKKGMVIKVASINPDQDGGDLYWIGTGSVKKNSPVLEVLEVEDGSQMKYYHNDRKVTLKSVIFKTSCGKRVDISTRQKVEVLSCTDEA